MTPEDPRHGSVAGYIAKCRQECCRAAWRHYRKTYTKRTYIARGPLRVDGTGTRRRLQALVANGFSLYELDRELGRKPTFCSYLISRDRPVLRTVADEVFALYERLSMTCPEGWSADRQRRQARRRGWAPPLAWEDVDINDPSARADRGARDTLADPVVVDRILAGDWTLLANPAERLQVIARWQGSDNQLEQLTGWNVARDRRTQSEEAA